MLRHARWYYVRYHILWGNHWAGWEQDCKGSLCAERGRVQPCHEQRRQPFARGAKGVR